MSGARADWDWVDADVGTGRLFLGICCVGGGPFVFSLHGHTD